MAKRKTRSKNSSPADLATQYAQDVVDRKIVAGPYVRLAGARHLKDLADGASRGLTWDVDAVDRVLRFFQNVLRHAGGAFEGKAFDPLPWECFILGSLYGWKKADGFRRYRTAYIEAGKGAGKSPLCGGIGLYMECADSEPRAEVYAAAYNQDQARVLFRPAVAMVEQSPALSRRLRLSGGVEKTNIADVDTGSFFRPISSERQGRGKSGPIPHCVLLDEIHEHPTNAMVEFLAAGVKHRRQPLVVLITNSGSDRQTVCWDYHTYAVQIAEGTREDDSFFSYVCALDDGDNPFADEACWVKANPSLPTVPGYDYVRQQVASAKGMPSKESLVRRLNFCQWTDAADSWIETEIWESALADLDIKDYEGQECYGGLDLSLGSDLTALVFAFVTGHRAWDVFSWFWMPGGRLLELQDRDGMAPRYQQWRDRGFLFAPDGKTIDYGHAANLIAEVCARFKVNAIAYDRHKIELLRKELDEIDCKAPLVPHGQGFYKAQETGLWMPGSIGELEAALRDKRIRVNRNPVLNWNVMSAVCQQSSIAPEDRYFSKRKATGRIDGAVALAMAIGVAAGDVAPPLTSPWEDENFRLTA